MTDWIPVSERLPFPETPVLVTITGIDHPVFLMVAHHDGQHWWIDDYPGDILAWMPLPEPYQPPL